MSCTAAKRYILQHQAKQAASTSSGVVQSPYPQSESQSIEVSVTTSRSSQNTTVVDCSVLPSTAASMVSATSANDSVSSRESSSSVSSSCLPPKKRFLSAEPKKRLRIVLTGHEDHRKDEAKPLKKIKLAHKDVPQVNLRVEAGQIQVEANQKPQAPSRREKVRRKPTRARNVERSNLEDIKRKVDELVTFTNGLQRENENLRRDIGLTAQSNQRLQERQRRRSNKTPPSNSTRTVPDPAAQQVQKFIDLIQTIRQRQQQQEEERNRQKNENQAHTNMQNFLRSMQATQAQQSSAATSSMTYLKQLMEKQAQGSRPVAQEAPVQNVARPKPEDDAPSQLSVLLRTALAQRQRQEPTISQMATPVVQLQQQQPTANTQALYNMLRQMNRH